jgi:chondroitin AC lyase
MMPRFYQNWIPNLAFFDMMEKLFFSYPSFFFHTLVLINQIGTPDALVSLLFIMDNDLTEEQIAKTLPVVGRANLDASGARPSGDRIKIAGILAKAALFKRDEILFNEVIKVIESEIKFSTGRGMQYDYSFHHRVDRVNNTLSYGTGYADAFAEWASLVSGTEYMFSDKAVHMLIDYYLDGICKMMVYGKYPDTGARNRSISRSGALNAFRTGTPEKLLNTSGYRKKELEEIVKIRNGEAKATLSCSSF